MLHAAKIIALCAALLLLPALGCSRMERAYYLETGRYAQGIVALSKEYAQDPWNPELNYYLGRFHLALGSGEKATGYLKRATILATEDAEYHYWLGVAYHAVGESSAEERALERSLAIDPEHVPARLALANIFLDQGKAAKALTHYDLALAVEHGNLDVLWGRAQALGKLGRRTERLEVLHDYLSAGADAPMAAQAVEELNLVGDYSWRIHTVGRYRLALPAVDFAPGTDSATVRGQEALASVAKALRDDPQLNIHVVAFVAGDQELARRRAQAVAAALREETSLIDRARLSLSWLGSSQQLRLGDTTRELDESILFITDAKKGA
ncbi:tetratricopeptide repeat protein [Desulfocurvibacter africanus]|uniref:Tetratricopeptide TPR_1 repeat-containing protein n=3 Tax=Desulfocurvibacter africanus TaxID=873 RepID=F3Z3M1_DESAF|nr:tetratricopeptide repeat protein [Desulfocurvibacter africanus]EGJ50393.1 Tetratricopeptide TPR_1 repeat-containing protein [Desulfocurvibacter africanus subsp. africanus str. Walvis Bay]